LSTNWSLGLEDSVCDAFGDNFTILPLVKCEEDMTSHLINLVVSSQRGRRSKSTISESILLLNRAGHFRIDAQKMETMTINIMSETQTRSDGRLART
jgi:hypothetical protein